jgi:hypothetical protein
MEQDQGNLRVRFFWGKGCTDLLQGLDIGRVGEWEFVPFEGGAGHEETTHRPGDVHLIALVIPVYVSPTC